MRWQETELTGGQQTTASFMLFNSFVFVGFFAAVYLAYLALSGRYRWQNALLLIASLVFYGCWDWRFLFLLGFTSVLDYVVSRRIVLASDRRSKRRFLLVSLVMNLGVLGFFKYFNFFTESAVHLLGLAGFHPDWATLRIILPVGISFYTFQAMSYTIDVYRGHAQPARTVWDFLLYVAFFPHLVAGPIQRTDLLKQISAPRRVRSEQVHAAVWLLLWGYAKKVVVADNTGMLADQILNNYTAHRGLDLLIGGLAFSAQIYGDFSGYSDIARGLAKLMGFELMVNFKLPYFAVSPQDFWRRWHVSLSTWLRDYLYIPLGGNRGSGWSTMRNLLLTMLLGGLWHGAAWTFVIWGAYHGLLLMGYRLIEQTRWGLMVLARVPVSVRMAAMFSLTVVGWFIFRSRSLEQLGYLLTHVGWSPSRDSRHLAYRLLFVTAPLAAVELWQHRRRDLLALADARFWWRSLLYGAMAVWLLIFGVRQSMEFIYFQF